MDILDDMGVSKLSAKVFYKSELLPKKYTCSILTGMSVNSHSYH